MKRYLSIILSLALLLSVSVSAISLDDESTLFIPSPSEIETYYRQMLSSSSEQNSKTSTLSLQAEANSDTNPLLILGAICSYAEENDDISALQNAVEIAREDLIPNLSADDYVTILSNEDYTDMFKFSVMDMYSYSAKTSPARMTKDFSEVDKILNGYVIPNGALVVDALASIQDKSIINADELAAIISSNDTSARQMALKTMCSEYPDLAYSAILNILSQESESSIVYRSAINFLPRLVNDSSNLTEATVLQIIDSILENTNDSFVQITCVQALAEVNSAAAAEILSNHIFSISEPLINYYNSNSDFTVDSGNGVSIVSVQPRSTSNRIGHAIYRDGVVFDQWHTGIVAHASGPEYFVPGSEEEDNQWVVHARGSGKTTGYDTFDTFMRNKQDEYQGYVGERYMSTMTLSDHHNVFFVADDMATEAIPYTFLNMISVSILAPGQLEVSDIEKIRCDGFVEFAYEYNGIELQASSVYWDISTYLGAINHDALLMTPKTQYDTFDRTCPR